MTTPRGTPLTDAIHGKSRQDPWIEAAYSELLYLSRSLERTVAELRYYASHAHLCNKDQTDEPPRPCDCGLDAILARLDGSKP